MYLYRDDTLQIGIDGMAMLSPTQVLVIGWGMVPRGTEAEFAVTADGATDCPILHCAFHPRPDVRPADPRAAEVNGFLLLAEVPDGTAELSLTLASGPLLLAADLFDSRVETDLFKTLRDAPPGIAFGFLRATVEVPALRPMLRHLGRPLGVFADWLGAMPVLRGRDEAIGPVAEAEALTTASGEALVMLRFPSVLPRGAVVEAVALAWLRGEGGIPEPTPLPFAEVEAARLPAALALYARLEPAVMDRLQILEIVLQVETAPRQSLSIRCQPALATVPEMLDLACRTTAASLAAPLETVASAGIGLLRGLIARREAAFGPVLGALAGQVGGATGLPRLALILGADDPMAARMFHVAADAFERRCDTVVVMGAAADDTAQVFASRGRLQVLAGVEAAATLREATGRAGVIALDAADFAAAVIAGDPDAAFAHPLQAGETARLLALHSVAGCAPELTDSLHRLAAARRGARFRPVQRGWANRHAAEIINAHLARLWGTEQEQVAHG